MLCLIAVAALAAVPERPAVDPPSPPPMPPTQELTPSVAQPSAPQDAPPSLETGLGEHRDAETPGSQFGIVGLLGATVDLAVRTRAASPLASPTTGPDFVGFGGLAAIGVRFGLFARTMERQWMPSVAVLTGSGFGPAGFSPFVEGRLEWLSVTGGGPLQPNFTVYGLGGVTSSRFGIYGAPPGLRPHAGLGLGWNWWPKGSGAGGSWGHLGGGWNGLGHPAGVLAAIGIAAMVFAGRVEVQYTAAPITGPGTDFVSVVVGVGG